MRVCVSDSAEHNSIARPFSLLLPPEKPISSKLRQPKPSFWIGLSFNLAPAQLVFFISQSCSLRFMFMAPIQVFIAFTVYKRKGVNAT